MIETVTGPLVGESPVFITRKGMEADGIPRVSNVAVFAPEPEPIVEVITTIPGTDMSHSMIIVPIIVIYARYYGRRMALFLEDSL